MTTLFVLGLLIAFIDEPEEVAVVKSALLKHLDLDPPVTLGVLCDQIVPPEEEMDEYERQTREGLRSLVISFLATDASGAIEKYTDPPGSEAEQILVDQLTLVCQEKQLTYPQILTTSSL